MSSWNSPMAPVSPCCSVNCRRLLERHHWSGVLRIRLEAREYRSDISSALPMLSSATGSATGSVFLRATSPPNAKTKLVSQELFETLQEGVYLADADGKLEDVNPAFVRMLGYDNRAELLGRRWNFSSGRRVGGRTGASWLNPTSCTAMKRCCAVAMAPLSPRYTPQL